MNKKQSTDIFDLDGEFKKSLHLLPKYEELIGPVAACHASLEKALNEFIFTVNPNLKPAKDLHFRFELATKIVFQMEAPYSFHYKNLQPALVGLNKLRNNLVHPTKLDIKQINDLYKPIIQYLRATELLEDIEKSITDKSTYPDLTGSIMRIFNSHAIGMIVGHKVVAEKILSTEKKILEKFSPQLQEAIKRIKEKR